MCSPCSQQRSAGHRPFGATPSPTFGGWKVLSQTRSYEYCDKPRYTKHHDRLPSIPHLLYYSGSDRSPTAVATAVGTCTHTVLMDVFVYYYVEVRVGDTCNSVYCGTAATVQHVRTAQYIA